MHTEVNESLQDAGVREVLEETGINLNVDEKHNEINILGLWESVFPPVLGIGLPHRHHIVIYLHHVSKNSASDIEANLKVGYYLLS